MSILGIGLMAGGVLLLIWLYGPGHPSGLETTAAAATPGGSGVSGFAVGPQGPYAGSGGGSGGGGSW